MLVDGAIREVAYAGVAKAVIEIEFKQPPTDDLKLLEADGADSSGAAGIAVTETEPKEESK